MLQTWSLQAALQLHRSTAALSSGVVQETQAKDCDLTETTVRAWANQTRADAGEREELALLR
ncbi:hypothetical protein ACIA8O_36555 [Kitasatospora sp. NPDC051853]|uniref:hypothetical protein n=1 Tax=Kitasatospora sp. NPDC051853 TaxID=3364058 RepID=UPI00378D8F0F